MVFVVTSDVFIVQTAIDYDMKIAEVRKIFNATKNYITFYEDLELFIKERAEK